jgi:hypothetical protein
MSIYHCSEIITHDIGEGLYEMYKVLLTFQLSKI